MANYKCLFFLDVGRMPAAIREQHFVPYSLIFQLSAEIFSQFLCQKKHIGCPHVLIKCNSGYIHHSTSENNVN